MTLIRSRFESGFDALRPLMMLVISLGFALTVSAREPDVVIDLWEGAPPGEPQKVGAEQDFPVQEPVVPGAWKQPGHIVLSTMAIRQLP